MILLDGVAISLDSWELRLRQVKEDEALGQVLRRAQ